MASEANPFTAGGSATVTGTWAPPMLMVATSIESPQASKRCSTSLRTAPTTDENTSLDMSGCSTACRFTSSKRAQNALSPACATCAVFTVAGRSASRFAG